MRTVLLLSAAALLTGCAGSNENQAKYLEERGARSEFVARGDYQIVYEVILGHAQGYTGSAGFANDYVVQGLPHPTTKSAEILFFLSNAFLGNQVYWYVKVTKATEETCTVTVLSPKSAFDKKHRHGQTVKGWLEKEGLLVQ